MLLRELAVEGKLVKDAAIIADVGVCGQIQYLVSHLAGLPVTGSDWVPDRLGKNEFSASANQRRLWFPSSPPTSLLSRAGTKIVFKHYSNPNTPDDLLPKRLKAHSGAMALLS